MGRRSIPSLMVTVSCEADLYDGSWEAVNYAAIRLLNTNSLSIHLTCLFKCSWSLQNNCILYFTQAKFYLTGPAYKNHGLHMNTCHLVIYWTHTKYG